MVKDLLTVVHVVLTCLGIHFQIETFVLYRSIARSGNLISRIHACLFVCLSLK